MLSEKHVGKGTWNKFTIIINYHNLPLFYTGKFRIQVEFIILSESGTQLITTSTPFLKFILQKENVKEFRKDRARVH